MELNKNCPVCHTKKGELLGILKYTMFDDSPIASSFNIVSCDNCGFVFNNTSSLQKEYDNYYKESFYSTEYIDRKLNSKETGYADRIINVLSPYLNSKDISIMDIGCGNGVLLEKLYKLGFNNLYGIDPSLSYANILNKKGIKFGIGSVTDISSNTNSTNVNIIILSHVLEHIVDLPLALKNIGSKLSKNGIIYIEVPDTVRYEEFGNPLRYLYLTHINHFDLTSLRNLFYINNLQDIKSGFSMRVEGDLSMPCIWAVFRKVELDGRIETAHDFSLANKVKTWFNNTQYNNLDTNNIINDLASSDKVIYVWGIGIHTQMMLGMSPLKECLHRIYFVDSDKIVQKKTIAGKAIHDPRILKNATEQDTVIIGAPTHSKKTCEYLTKEMKFKGRIIIVEFTNITNATNMNANTNTTKR